MEGDRMAISNRQKARLGTLCFFHPGKKSMETEEDAGFSLFAPSKKSPSSSANAKSSTTENEMSTAMSKDGLDADAKDFKGLHLDNWQVETLSGLSIFKPTQVQAACIPAILKELDVCAAARTGSGKTAAFALPILKKLSEDPFGVYALVLTPTRYSRYFFFIYFK
jgi:ATP-dependent RNA helicase DDX49/DBP8